VTLEVNRATAADVNMAGEISAFRSVGGRRLAR
jgi:hypothetical protein